LVATDRSSPVTAASTGLNTIAALSAPAARPAVTPSAQIVLGSPLMRERASRMRPTKMSGGSDR
jgi:hypothetical protein